MNTVQLHYFLSASRHLSFSEAAKELYMTQPAISRQISDLESELGVKLFSRTARGVVLTKAGELFLEDAKRMLDMESMCKERLLALNASETMHLSVAYLASPCKYFLPEVISQFHNEYPQVEISLHRLDALGVLSAIEADRYDIYFSLMEDLAYKKDYNTRKIHEDHFCLVCRMDHPCLQTFKIDYDKIATEPFLMFNPEKAAYMSKQINKVCRDLNFSPRVVHTYDTMEETLFAVESGLGITILPYKIKDYVKSALVYSPLDSSSTACGFGAAWKKENTGPAIGWFVSVLNRYLIQISS